MSDSSIPLDPSMNMTLFCSHMTALDAMTAGRLDNVELKIRQMVDQLYRRSHYVWYSSDGGISRIVVQVGLRNLRLDGPPSRTVETAWETREVRTVRRSAELYLVAVCEELRIPKSF